MSQYVVTYAEREGANVLSLAVSLDNDEQGRQFASRTARRCHAVSLFAADGEGFTRPIAEWLNGVLQRQNGSLRAVVDEPEVETEDEVSDEEDIEISSVDEAHHFTGRCMHCKTNREFVGRVKELSNGSKAAMGHCPVCGTTITRMVSRTTPVDEWDDTDTEHPDTDENAPEIQPTDADDYNEAEQQEAEKAEIAEAISEVAAGEPIAEVAEQVTELAAEFSHAAAEVEQPAPAKKATAKKAAPAKKQAPAKKATAKSVDGRTPNQRGAASTEKAICPKCDQSVDVIVRGGLKIYSLHPDEAHGMDRCPGSTTVLPGQGI